MSCTEEVPITLESLPRILENDNKVKVAGVDVDGILRGKIISKKKFLKVVETGFGFCSGIFRWDMHDNVYPSDLNTGSQDKMDMPDILAIPDLSSFRRIPWENNVPFFLVSFYDPLGKKPVEACPRGQLKKILEKLKLQGFKAMAGVEYEFSQFRVPSVAQANSVAPGNQESIVKFLEKNAIASLPPLTEGRFGYSLTRSVQNLDYFYDIFNTCEKFNCSIEGWHSETGPGVFEAALSYCEAQQLADKASLFKYVVKSVAIQYGITPCFMAKPSAELAGNSGHIHISIVDENGKNLFAREEKDPCAEYEDIANLSDMGRQFLAGILDGLPDIMPLFAPTINSYKRLDERFFAPATISWGLEHRAASIRLIAPPTAALESTRFEVRVPGADTNPYYVLATVIALGWRGVEKKLELKQPPLPKIPGLDGRSKAVEPLAKSLREATDRFLRKESVAREIFGDEFVDHFGRSRNHEIRQWDEAVTDWELRRYIETV